IQEREVPHLRTCVGPGKVNEIKNVAASCGAGLIVYDHDLTPSQEHNLEQEIGRKILDRTALILDIFAQHAHSKEGKLQVELAQHLYRLPRLKGKGTELSRLGGGIGTRGPGETKLETDRRRIRQKIRHLQKQLSHVKQVRATQRKKRNKEGIFSISIVGYTNAGKSTLLNTLTHANVLVEDMLFATLDSTTRRLVLPGHQRAVISDTVGFIKKLPHQLVASFRSTLDEVGETSLILHIIDASHPLMDKQIETVEDTLKEIGVENKPVLSVFNKIDRLSKTEEERLRRRFSDGVFVSALKRREIDKLLLEIDKLRSFFATKEKEEGERINIRL
ncbi:MAG: GTPase HflX, partial [Candidatus Subteraquimicrobiales bacterium]|nr:GTPase HflX [Candidatus Subteraquimicrobiales bacterium]